MRGYLSAVWAFEVLSRLQDSAEVVGAGVKILKAKRELVVNGFSVGTARLNLKNRLDMRFDVALLLTRKYYMSAAGEFLGTSA